MLEDKCGLAIRRYDMLKKGDRLIVGLSGGADSCALLHFLCSIREEYSLNITAVHVNHMIRGEEAERDAAFAEKFCNDIGVEFHLYKRNIPSIAAEKGTGLEQCGREIRYGIFSEEAAGCPAKIATAHTLSDSVETVLFHIIRGCSVNGLKGIPPVRGNIIRPLIFCERADIEDYCARYGIDYVTDSTNLSTDYARNKIRLQILPLMRQLNPLVNEAIGRLSETAASDDRFICEFAKKAADDFLFSGSTEQLLNAEPPVLSRAVIMICSERLGIIPEQKHVAAMCDSIYAGSGSVNLPMDNIFRVYNNSIYFAKKADHHVADACGNNWEADFLRGEIITPCGQKIFTYVLDKNKFIGLFNNNKNKKNDENIFKNCLDYDTIKKAAFRFRREGDIFSPAGRNCSKSLKKLFNEEKLSPDIRGRIPLLESEGCIAWICGIGAAEQFKVTDATEIVLYIDADLRDIMT